MIASVEFAAAPPSTSVKITLRDGTCWWTGVDLPPDTGLRRELRDWLNAGGVVAPYSEAAAEYLPSAMCIDGFGLARFVVSNGVLEQTGDAKNIAGVIRLAAGKYRIYLTPPPETLMAFPVAIDPSNDRRAFPAPRAADHFDIRVVNAAGALCDAAEVYVEFKRVI
ncbi:hypothetical protein [Rhodopseudomonas parapalustris]